jgi:hypothetical protein
MMERIIEGFEIHLGMRRRLKSAVAAEPQAESQKGETSR